MPTKYCSYAGCGAKFEYSYDCLPTVCPKCHRELAKAFVSAASNQEKILDNVGQHTSPTVSRDRSVRPSLREQVLSKLKQNHGQKDDDLEQDNFYQNNDDYVDKNIVHAMANELIASLNSDSFVPANLMPESGGGRSFKFGDIVQEAKNSVPSQSVEKTTPRRRTKKSHSV